MAKEVDYYDYCRKIRRLKETNGINKSLKMMLLDLADMHGDNGKIFPNNKTLADNNCISEKSIDGLLSRARKNRLIKTSPARKGQNRFITLLCPDSGEPIFLQIRKKNTNKFANMQKSSGATYYKNDKIKDNGAFLPLKEPHLPTSWNGFLLEINKNEPDRLDLFLNIPEKEWINCPEFISYLNVRSITP